MIWLIIIPIILVVLFLIFFLISLCAYRVAFYVPKKRTDDIYNIPSYSNYPGGKEKMIALINEMKDVPFERIYTTSFDGLKLAARYYHVKDGAPLQIQFHGYRGSPIRDFSGGNKLARENGFNTIVVEHRAHGCSEGHTITFGIKERYDCLSWIEYAIGRFGVNTPIYLAGVSMGAATVLMASELNLPNNVKGIVADCPYSSPYAIIRRVCTYRGFPPKLAMPLIVFGAKVFGHFNLKESSAVDAVKNAKTPILLIHGEADAFVPCDMSKEICAAGKDIRLVTFPGASHGISYVVDPERYRKVALNFLEECEKNS